MPKLYYIGGGDTLHVYVLDPLPKPAPGEKPAPPSTRRGHYEVLAAVDTDTEELAAYGIPEDEVRASGLWDEKPPEGHPDHPKTSDDAPVPPSATPVGAIVGGMPRQIAKKSPTVPAPVPPATTEPPPAPRTLPRKEGDS